MAKVILNLGCNDSRLPGTVGVDIIKRPAVDVVHDLNHIPYPFPDNHADEIHMYHVLEHLDNPIKVIEELHRILKPGGRLYLRVPHFSSLYAWGDITHKRAFTINCFDVFDTKHDYKKWGYSGVKFHIVTRKIRYFYTWPNEKWYLEHIVAPDWHPLMGIVLKPLILVVNFLIKMSPDLFERFWCYLVGGAAEIYIIMDAKK
ncbi:class I SAM-dependent methyltransferase [Patescibacteria group bacterium]|nr:class I SAM-dependent methyltransferase [Patescibacteria group bacterium]MBU1970427.1 class I SAM-dependent methyltransferase [Patescibacteria group bacterium]